MNAIISSFLIFLNKGVCLPLQTPALSFDCWNWFSSMDGSQSFNVNVSSLENLVVFDWVEGLGEVLVWWTMILLE